MWSLSTCPTASRSRRWTMRSTATRPCRSPSTGWRREITSTGRIKWRQVLQTRNTHHSWMGQVTKIVTGEVVYYILSGTSRAPQKCFWSHLRVEFSGENNLLMICGKMPNQTWWITKYLDSGLNSDLFKKKAFPNPCTNSKVTAVQKWLPFYKNGYL